MKKLEELDVRYTPWKSYQKCDWITMADGRSFRMMPHDMRDSEIHLVAAAPDLYKALYDILSLRDNRVDNFKEFHEKFNEAFKFAENALAKAAGENL